MSGFGGAFFSWLTCVVVLRSRDFVVVASSEGLPEWT